MFLLVLCKKDKEICKLQILQDSILTNSLLTCLFTFTCPLLEWFNHMSLIIFFLPSLYNTACVPSLHSKATDIFGKWNLYLAWCIMGRRPEYSFLRLWASQFSSKSLYKNEEPSCWTVMIPCILVIQLPHSTEHINGIKWGRSQDDIR